MRELLASDLPYLLHRTIYQVREKIFYKVLHATPDYLMLEKLSFGRTHTDPISGNIYAADMLTDGTWETDLFEHIRLLTEHCPIL